MFRASRPNSSRFLFSLAGTQPGLIPPEILIAASSSAKQGSVVGDAEGNTSRRRRNSSSRWLPDGAAEGTGNI